MNDLIQDIRYAARMLIKNPGFTFIALLTLALGIGANTAIFSVVNAVVLRSMPYKNADRLVMLGYALNEAAPANYIDWRNQNATFEDMAAISFWSANLSGESEPERAQAFLVTPSLFPVLGAQALQGRTFLPEEGDVGKDNVVVLSHHLWQRRFNSDPGLVGRAITINARSYEVVGVMPPDFQFYRPADLWIPLAFTPQEANRRTLGNLIVVARLKPQISFRQAQTEMTAISQRLAEMHPQTNEGVTVNMITLHESITGHMRPALLVMLAAVGFVLLIACANVANLLLARAAAREKEIALRVALGAGRFRIVRQLLTESVLLGLMGGALGLLLALWLVGGLISLVPPNTNLIPRSNEIAIDGWTLGFTLLASLVTGVLFGLAPALQLSKPDLNKTLKEESWTTAGSRRKRSLRSLLVVSGVVFSLVLLIGAGLMIKSFLRLLDVDLGFDAKNTLSMRVSLLQSKYSTNAQIKAFYNQAIDKIKSLPEAQYVGAISHLPLGGSNRARTFIIEGRPLPGPGEQGVVANSRIATPDYFRALGIPLLKGRALTEQDDEGAPSVAVINSEMARRFFGQEDPLGKRIRQIAGPGQEFPWLEIVGIVGNVRHSGVETEPAPEIYAPLLQNASRDMTLVIRSNSDPLNLASAARQQILSVDKDQPVFNVKTMEEVVADSVFLNQFSMYLLGAFACLALILAASGIYSTMSYTVARRTREIGIRVALGAQPFDMLKMIIKQGMSLMLIGVGIGLMIAFLVMRFMARLLYGVSEKDLTTFATAALFLTLVAFISSYLPARRATKIDPMVALRSE